MMQTSIPERPRTLIACLLLGIILCTGCTKFERDYVTDNFNNCMAYANTIEDEKRQEETKTTTSEIIKLCNEYANTLKVKNE